MTEWICTLQSLALHLPPSSGQRDSHTWFKNLAGIRTQRLIRDHRSDQREAHPNPKSSDTQTTFIDDDR